MANGTGKRGPRLWHWAIVVAIALCGVADMIVFVSRDISKMATGLHRMQAPGKAEMQFERGLGYSVYLERDAQGERTSPPKPSGLICRVQSAKGEEVALQAPRVTSSYTDSGRAGRSLYSFAVARTGRYIVHCGYGEGPQGPNEIVSVSKDLTGPIFFCLFNGLVLLAASVAAGVGAAVWAFVLRARARRLQQTQPTT